MCVPSEVENAPGWVHSLSWVTQGFPGPQTKHGRGVRPLSSPVTGMRAVGRLGGENRQSREKNRAAGKTPVAVSLDWERRHLGGDSENVNSRPYRPWSRAFANRS